MASLELAAFEPSSQTISSARRPSMADHVLSATTATPVEICRTCFTPRIPLAFESSTLLTLPPKTGQRATTACCMLGKRTSMPKLALPVRSEEHTSELQSQSNLVCRLLL